VTHTERVIIRVLAGLVALVIVVGGAGRLTGHWPAAAAPPASTAPRGHGVLLLLADDDRAQTDRALAYIRELDHPLWQAMTTRHDWTILRHDELSRRWLALTYGNPSPHTEVDFGALRATAVGLGIVPTHLLAVVLVHEWTHVDDPDGMASEVPSLNAQGRF
jgi:hypothetical protein